MKLRVTEIIGFRAALPVPQEAVQAGVLHRVEGVKIETDIGLSGYGWGYVSPQVLTERIRPLLLGKDPLKIENYAPELRDWASVEHALWDIAGKLAGLPVYRLLGGASNRLRAYVTCVWLGPADQSHITPEEQAQMAQKYNQGGFQGIKIRIWRPNPEEDLQAVALIREATQGQMAVMVDRTAHHPGKVWDWGTAYKIARRLEEVGAHWLEEPLDREDLQGLRRLREAVDLPITGGEAGRGLESFRRMLEERSLDILQPDARNCGGLLTIKKIEALAQAYHIPCFLHGSNGFSLAATVQASCSLHQCEWLEIALVHPPLLPQEMWQALENLLESPPLFHWEDGYLLAPEKPGLGVDINEEALVKVIVERW